MPPRGIYSDVTLPYELRICDKCDWHTVQDEEHILLDCPHEHHLIRKRLEKKVMNKYHGRNPKGNPR